MKSKTILSQSSEILSYFNHRDQLCFTSQQAVVALKSKSPKTVSQLLNDMTRRGLLMKIKKGVYYIIPYDQQPENFMPDWHLLAKYLVGEADYYIGYYSAMQIHSLITQPALKEQIVVNKQLKPSLVKVKMIPFQFIYHNKKHFFGGKKTWVNSFNQIQCSDLEKTIVDALFKPDYAGGISEIARAIYKSKEIIDYKKLFDYAVKFDSIAVSKRLGYLLEILNIENPIIDLLQKINSKSYFLLDPSAPENDILLPKWKLFNNVDKQSILSPLFS